MKKIEASKLNRNLKEVLDAVAGGTKYEVTRYGKVVAKILPPNAREPKDPDVLTDAQVDALEHVPHPTPEEIRQKRREFLMSRIAIPKKDG